ncbi:MAG: hypothetical protein IKV13_07965, partial [Akkermansia sp.]|nr:hypothetical protein [Akkermansia sp.]
PALWAGRYRHLVPTISAPTERTGWLQSERSEDIVCGNAADIVQLRWISSLPDRARISFTGII